MSRDTIEILGVIAASLLGLGGALAGAYFYWEAKVKKGYAAERDFNHLRRNYEGLSSAIANLDKELEALDRELDSRLDRIDLTQIEMKSLLNTLIATRSIKNNEK